jgi:hypothetical protein
MLKSTSFLFLRKSNINKGINPTNALALINENIERSENHLINFMSSNSFSLIININNNDQIIAVHIDCSTITDECHNTGMVPAASPNNQEFKELSFILTILKTIVIITIRPKN